MLENILSLVLEIFPLTDLLIRLVICSLFKGEAALIHEPAYLEDILLLFIFAI